MKTILKSILICLFAISCFGETNAQGKKKTEEITIKTSAVCGMCKSTIEKAMAYEKGVKDFNLDVKSQTLTIKYNPSKTDPDKIKKAVSMVGYDADEIKADAKAYEKLNNCCKKENGVH